MSLLQVLILETCVYTKQIVAFLIKSLFYQVSQFHLSSIWMMIHPSTYIDCWICFNFTLFINIGQYKEHKIWAWNFSNYSQFMEFKKKSLEATLKGFFSSLKESSNHPQIKKRKTEVWTPYSIMQPMYTGHLLFSGISLGNKGENFRHWAIWAVQSGLVSLHSVLCEVELAIGDVGLPTWWTLQTGKVPVDLATWQSGKLNLAN